MVSRRVLWRQVRRLILVTAVLGSLPSCGERDKPKPQTDSGEGRTGDPGWGPLRPLARNMGPGSAFQRFVAALEAATPKDDRNAQWSWNLYSIELPTLNPTARFRFTVTGRGKFFSEMAVSASELTDKLFVEVMFRDDPLSELQQAVQNRDRRVTQAARAMQLNQPELRRLSAVLSLLPMARDRVLEEAMWGFVARMPPHVQRRFRAAWRYRDGGLDSIRAKAVVGGVGPAIGFPLSDERIADIAFCATTNLVFYKGKPHKFGPWWTVALWPLADESITQHGEAEQGGNITSLPWPRLALAEVDALVQGLQ